MEMETEMAVDEEEEEDHRVAFSSSLPAPVPPSPHYGLKMILVACGWRHTIAVSTSGDLYTYGWSKYGQLGHGDFEDHWVPHKLEALSGHRISQFGQVGVGANVDRLCFLITRKQFKFVVDGDTHLPLQSGIMYFLGDEVQVDSSDLGILSTEYHHPQSPRQQRRRRVISEDHSHDAEAEDDSPMPPHESKNEDHTC
ncbi:Ultraviolet-B receptor UVR8-like protein [Drosera capensis]